MKNFNHEKNKNTRKRKKNFGIFREFSWLFFDFFSSKSVCIKEETK